MNQPHNPDVLHQQYKSAVNSEKRIIRLVQLFIFLSFFGIWQLASSLKWIDPLIFSSPLRVWNLFIEKTGDGSLLEHIGFTLFETVLGFIIGTLCGIILATLLWYSNRLAKVLDPYLVILNAMPKVALYSILIVAIGPGFFSILTMGAIISVIITAIVVYTAFKEVDPNYVKLLQSFGATKHDCFKQAILPSTMPAIISTFKVNVGLSWVGVIVGEFLVSSKGLGYMIIYGFQVFNFTLVILSLLLIAVFATGMYQAISYLEKRLTRH
ncbi:ABC transporter permease [Priestia flexa]|nr:ABC transporter permease [Priestia flexa]